MNLGRLILEDTDILLLDEPTNHLDLQATEWLEEYIRSFQGTVVAISHDRYFLDRTVTRVIEIAGRQGGVLQRQLQLLRRGEGAPLPGADEAVRERAGQDRSSSRRRRSKLRLWAFMGNDKTAQAGPSPWKSALSGCGPPPSPRRRGRWTPGSRTAEFHGDEVLVITERVQVLWRTSTSLTAST